MIAAGRILLTALAFAAGASAQAPDRSRQLVLAAEKGDTGEVRRLIAAGADVNWQDEKQDSAFLIAGARGHAQVVKLTLAAGANLKSTNRYGGTALIPACHYGHVETVRVLLGTAIDVDHVNNLGWTALLETVILGDGGPRHVEITRLLLERRANSNIADREGISPLAHARQRGYSEMARLIAGAGGR
ncbi:MAG: ankyrin repeat domain-containing protein [Betaproteobacteria bacterium]